jgi:hypothetical protein
LLEVERARFGRPRSLFEHAPLALVLGELGFDPAHVFEKSVTVIHAILQDRAVALDEVVASLDGSKLVRR